MLSRNNSKNHLLLLIYVVLNLTQGMWNNIITGSIIPELREATSSFNTIFVITGIVRLPLVPVYILCLSTTFLPSPDPWKSNWFLYLLSLIYPQKQSLPGQSNNLYLLPEYLASDITLASSCEEKNSARWPSLSKQN